MLYAWLKAGHLIFVIFWVAGLFMLPRFYVYHQEAAPGSDEEKRWIERETKLRTIIITPAMILVWMFGLLLAYIDRRLDASPGSSPSSRSSSRFRAITAG